MRGLLEEPNDGTLAVGGTITGGTAGSVLFVNPNNVIAQNNANFFWDNVNNRLGIGTTGPNYKLEVNGTSGFTGNMVMTTDNTYDIGASGATRPRTVYAGTSVTTPLLKAISTGGAPTTGRATLVADTVTVNTTAATATANVFLQRLTAGGTIGFATTITRVNNTSFTITSDNILDTSIYMWFIVEAY